MKQTGIKKESELKTNIKTEIKERINKQKLKTIEIWNTCKKCQKERFDKDSCNNYSCNNWFIRSKETNLYTELCLELNLDT